MSNASQALIMAAGIVVSVLILALIVTLFASSSSLSNKYDEAKHLEAVQQYNSIFTQYLGRDLTIHEVTTIRNLVADKKNVKLEASGVGAIYEVVGEYKPHSSNTVAGDGSDNNVPKYRLTVEFDSLGYINKLIIDEK